MRHITLDSQWHKSQVNPVFVHCCQYVHCLTMWQCVSASNWSEWEHVHFKVKYRKIVRTRQYEDYRAMLRPDLYFQSTSDIARFLAFCDVIPRVDGASPTCPITEIVSLEIAESSTNQTRAASHRPHLEIPARTDGNINSLYSGMRAAAGLATYKF